MEEHKVSTLIKLKVIPEKKEALVKHLLAFSELILKDDDGIEIFIVSISPKDDDVIYIYEVYSNACAKELHESTELYIQHRVRTNNLMHGLPEVIFLTPRGGKGLKNEE